MTEIDELGGCRSDAAAFASKRGGRRSDGGGETKEFFEVQHGGRKVLPMGGRANLVGVCVGGRQPSKIFPFEGTLLIRGAG